MRKNSKAGLATAALFILGIYLPLVGMTFPFLDFSPKVDERRELAQRPSFTAVDISTFVEQYESFFNDHFGFRKSLLRLNNLIRLKVFNSSASPKVLVGKEGWLFYKGDYSGDGFPIANHLGILPAHTDLFRDCKNDLEAKKRFFDRMGIRYVFVVAPDKWSIYPEYLPKGFGNIGKNSLADLLIDHLQANSSVDIVDLRKVMFDLKRPDQPLYYKYDTHWNDLGAYFGYREIAKRISGYFPIVSPRELNDFEVSRSTSTGESDLARMLSLEDMEDVSYRLEPKRPYSYVTVTEESVGSKKMTFINENSDLPRALVFRDSFMDSVIPFLSDDFSKSTYVWSRLNSRINLAGFIKSAKPDIVIEEVTERYLLQTNISDFKAVSPFYAMFSPTAPSRNSTPPRRPNAVARGRRHPEP